MKRSSADRHRTVRATLPVVAVAALLGGIAAAQSAGAPRRIVSVIPAVTETLFALGAGSQIVGIGSFDVLPERHRDATIARVGGLLDPDTERMLSLRPDLVILYDSQVDPRAQLERAGIPVVTYRHGTLTDVLGMVRALGPALGTVAREHCLRTGSRRGSPPCGPAPMAGGGPAPCSSSLVNQPPCAVSTPPAGSGSFTTCS